MILDSPSFIAGVILCAAIAGGWYFGWQAAVRHHRRIVRHGRNLDLVYFEDAIRDDSVQKPQAASAEVTPFTITRQSER